MLLGDRLTVQGGRPELPLQNGLPRRLGQNRMPAHDSHAFHRAVFID